MNVGRVYVIGVANLDVVKVGFSTTPDRRLDDLQTSNPFQLVLLKTYPGTMLLERYLHGRLSGYHLRGEWFSIPHDAAVEQVDAILKTREAWVAAFADDDDDGNEMSDEDAARFLNILLPFVDEAYDQVVNFLRAGDDLATLSPSP